MKRGRAGEREKRRRERRWEGEGGRDFRLTERGKYKFVNLISLEKVKSSQFVSH